MSSNVKINRTCEYCKKEFTAQTTVTRYCSRECNRKDYKQRARNAKISRATTKSQSPTASKDLELIKVKEFLSVQEAALLLGTSKRTVYRMINTGTINAVNLAERKTIIRKIEIEILFSRAADRSGDPRDEGKNLNQISKPLSLDEWVKAGGENLSECYNITDIQNKYGMSERAVIELIKRNGIPRVKLGWYVYVSKATIDKLFGNNNSPL